MKEKLRQRAALGVALGPSTSECIACLPLACAACPRMLLLRFLQGLHQEFEKFLVVVTLTAEIRAGERLCADTRLMHRYDFDHELTLECVH